MWLLLMEMLIALALLLFIVWWVAFPSRRGEQRKGRADPPGPD